MLVAAPFTDNAHAVPAVGVAFHERFVDAPYSTDVVAAVSVTSGACAAGCVPTFTFHVLVVEPAQLVHVMEKVVVVESGPRSPSALRD